jgi:hypothetical protein
MTELELRFIVTNLPECHSLKSKSFILMDPIRVALDVMQETSMDALKTFLELILTAMNHSIIALNATLISAQDATRNTVALITSVE